MFRHFEVVESEANDWWRSNDIAGAVLNRMMLLFIILPIVLVFKEFYLLSFLVFALMVPYGLFLRHLATRAVRRFLEANPETLVEFEQSGIVENMT